MDSAAVPAVRAAVGRILEEPSPGVVTLPEALRLAEFAGVAARLMCRILWSEHRASLALRTTDPSPRLVLRFDDDPAADGSIGEILATRRQVDEDAWAYPVALPCMTTRFFLRLTRGSACHDIRGAEAAEAVLRTHGWREDVDPERDFAEVMIDARGLAEAIVRLTGIDPEAW